MSKVIPGEGPAPVAEVIERHFGSRPTLMVKQTRKGCLRECMGCEATSEFNIATKENKKDNM